MGKNKLQKSTEGATHTRKTQHIEESKQNKKEKGERRERVHKSSLMLKHEMMPRKAQFCNEMWAFKAVCDLLQII